MTTCGTRCWEVEISTLWTFPPNTVLSEYIKGWKMTMSQHYTVWKRSSTQRSDTKVMLFKALFGAIKTQGQGARATVDIQSSDRNVVLPHKWIFTVLIPSANSRNIKQTDWERCGTGVKWRLSEQRSAWLGDDGSFKYGNFVFSVFKFDRMILNSIWC